MSGHSKWSTIKRKKGVTDARRGQLFTKLARELSVSARAGGPDPDMNVRLRLAVQKARENNMPLDNIERAIQRGGGVGDDGQSSLDEVVYEGYGPGGAALMVEAVTDNTTRTVAEVRSVFSRAGGHLGEKNSVAWNFDPRGVVVIAAGEEKTEELTLLAIDAGAEDFEHDTEHLEVRTSPEALENVRASLEQAGARVVRAEVTMVPKATLALDARTAAQTLRLMDRLEDLDDVQKVYTNADFPDEALEEYQKAS